MTAYTTEQPPPYQPANQPEVVHQALLDRSARIEPTQTPTDTSTLTDEELVKLTLQWVPPPPSTRPSSRLPKLVAIPQVDRDSYVNGATPFLRAFAPCLAAHLIAPKDFAAFIDGITIAQAPSPPIQVADAVSDGLGFVPDLWAQMASLGIGIAAGAASEATYYARTKMFLKKANAEYFAPRGLRVSVLKDGELQQLVGLSQDVRPLAPVDVQNNIISTTDRRMAALEGRIASISTDDIPAAVQPTNLIDRLSAKQVERRIKKTREGQVKKVAKQEKKAAEKEAKMAKKNGELVATRSSLSPGTGYSTFMTADTSSTTLLSPCSAQHSTSHSSLPSYQEDQTTGGYSRSSSLRSASPHLSPSASSRLDPQLTAVDGTSDSRRIQELQLKAQQINLEFDRRKLKKDNQKPSKQGRLDEERAEKLAEIQKKIEKERGKVEKKQERPAEDVVASSEKANLEGNQAWDWYGDEDRRRAALGPAVSDKDLAKRKEEEMKTLEKERKMAAKLRWIVVENLPDHGAFPDEGTVVEERRRFW